MVLRSDFGAETTANEVLEGLDLSGKTILVTGGTSGLGAETARALASNGAHLVVTARNKEKALLAVDQIQKRSGNSHIEIEELELGSMESIRSFADRFLTKYDNLNILINNAGVMACPLGRTEDGFELQFGTNYLGHFLMTNLLVPALIKGAPARIVNLSSIAHRLSPVLFDDPNFEASDYDSWQSYGQSKTANALFSVELTRRLKTKGVEAFSVHPGVIQTPLMRHLSTEEIEAMEESIENSAGGRAEAKTVEAGAATSCFAATASELMGRGGSYLADCAIQQVNDDFQTFDGVRSYALSPENAKRLWAISEELLGQSFLD